MLFVILHSILIIFKTENYIWFYKKYLLKSHF